MHKKSYLVIANHTSAGKTLVSSLMCYRFKLAYFKPIESGNPPDSEWVKENFPEIKVYKPLLSFCEEEPPHILERRYGQTLTVNQISQKLPEEDYLCEIAGGWYSPLNGEETMADLAQKISLPLILVIRPYLGAINHTLLTLEAIFQAKIPLAGYVINGEDKWGLEGFILKKHPSLKCLAKIPELKYFGSNYLKELSFKLWP